MRVFVAGGSGVLGRALVPLLVAEGHEVSAMTRSLEKEDLLASLGAAPVVCDVYDIERLVDVVTAAAPEVVMHQLTDLPDELSEIFTFAERNARMRREGTSNLLQAAGAAGASRVIAQSVSWELPGDAGASVRDHEHAILDAGGVIVRYGQLYGPGTYYETSRPDPPRVEVMEAARQTLPTLHALAGTIVVINESPNA